MKLFAIVPKGAEQFFANELKELKIKSEIKEEIVLFETDKPEEVAFKTFLAKKLCQILDIKTIKLKGESFGVRVWHPINKEIDRQELEAEIGSTIFKKTKLKVDLEHPDNWVIAWHDKETILGLDLTCNELDKRPYRIFNNPQALKATTAVAALHLANYNEKSMLIDPFCRSGEIAVEAALIGTKSSAWKYRTEFCKLPDKLELNITKITGKLYCYDDFLPNVTAAKKNAKLAGVEKSINFSRTDISWLDTKHNKETVDMIVTQPPIINEQNKKAEKYVEELFYQAGYVLKPSGCIVVATTMNVERMEIAKKYDFLITERLIVYSGKKAINLFKFTRNK